MDGRTLVVLEVRCRDGVQFAERTAINGAVDLLEFRPVGSDDSPFVRFDLVVVGRCEQYRSGGHRDDDDADQPDDFQLLVVEVVVDVHADLHPAGGWGAGARASA
ncbi:hypothetical protein [Halorubrum sp. PV6]|uniref:hypothetical protein n=1 Tax=Halorubrum sp. PV6 TaxID=634157 RepID=UPI001447137F|nr:hypothetical protein [Halorubrum sp. PV6]